MRVKIKQDMKVFHGHVPTNLAAGQEVTGSLAAMLATQAPQKVETLGGEIPEPEHPTPSAELDIEASVADVLAWVGEDADRATEALAAEEARDKPRSSLTKQLRKLAAEHG